jgi:hypothetical protein
MYGGELPFTGSLFTLPLIALGLMLSLGGWVGGRLKKARARA